MISRFMVEEMVRFHAGMVGRDNLKAPTPFATQIYSYHLGHSTAIGLDNFTWHIVRSSVIHDCIIYVICKNVKEENQSIMYFATFHIYNNGF